MIIARYQLTLFQTTANACATVALLNIIMNAENIELGKDLNDFKSQTREMDPPLRGHMITTNAAIRTVHNSFARSFIPLD